MRMGSTDGQESCGRCSFTTVVDAVESDDEDEPFDPFEGKYIEVDERELRIVAMPAIWAGRAKQWLTDTVNRFIYG